MPCNLSSQTLPEKAAPPADRLRPLEFHERPCVTPVCEICFKKWKAGDGKFYMGDTNQEIRVQGSWNANRHAEIMLLPEATCESILRHGTFGDATRRLARHADARTNRQVDIQPPDTSLTSLARADTPDGHPRVAHSRGSSRTGKNLPSEARGDGCRYAPRQPGNPALHRVPGRIGARNRARRCQTPRGS